MRPCPPVCTGPDIPSSHVSSLFPSPPRRGVSSRGTRTDVPYDPRTTVGSSHLLIRPVSLPPRRRHLPTGNFSLDIGFMDQIPGNPSTVAT